MVQVLPKIPGFGELAANAFGENFNKAFSRGQEMSMQMAMEKYKSQQEMEQFSKMFSGGMEEQPSTSNTSTGQTNEMQEAYLAHKFPNVYKARKEKQEKQEAQKGITDSLDWLEDNIKYSGRLGLHPKFGGVEAQGERGALGIKSDKTGKNLSDLEIKQIREGIDTTGLWAADKVYTHFNKGVINKEKWDSVKNDLAPNSKLPAKINRARIEGLRRIMGLPPNAPKEIVDKAINREVKVQNKMEASLPKTENKKLTQEAIKKFSEEAGFDAEKAAELARAAGYTW